METKVMANLPSQIPTFKTNYFVEQQSAPSTPSPPAPNFTIPDSWPFLYGNPQLDFNKESILGQYIHRIYCRECREQENMAAANQAGGSSPPNGSTSPQYQMDQLSISSSMDVNKESLKRKLMVRRSVHELVDQGIYPSLKSPAAFAEQSLHLLRAQTGDRLNRKIQSRPDRQSLVEQHILEDSNADPSLHERQRQLKKAKLTDQLNDKIAHRPGPLELVENNILQVEDKLAHAVKEGKIDFHKTEEGVDTIVAKLPYEVESPKSGTSSPEPLDCDNDSNAGSTHSGGFTHIPSPPDITPLLATSVSHVTIGGRTIPVTTTQSFLSNPTVTVSPQQVNLGSNAYRPISSYSSSSARRNNRKQKLKPQQKQRVIKFHEYKGPPTTSKNGATPNSSFLTSSCAPNKQQDDQFTPYHFSLQQQHLLLQCQVEIQSSQETLPGLPTVVAVPVTQQSPSASEPSPPKQLEQRSRPATPVQTMRSPPISSNKLHASRSLSALEDMKVADLKTELKMRNLPVSGSKPQLIERLRGHQNQHELSSRLSSVSSDMGYYPNTPSVQSVYSTEDPMSHPPQSVASSYVSSPPNSPVDDSLRSPPSLVHFALPTTMDTDENSQGAKHAEIVRQQQKKIEELQKALRESQQQLQQQQFQPFVVPPPPLQQPTTTRLPTATVPSVPAAPLPIAGKQVLLTTADGKMTTFKVVPLQQASPLVQRMVSPPQAQATEAPGILPAAPTFIPENTENSQPMPKLVQNPPSYEASPKTNTDVQTKNMNPIDVDDVLEILIRTGEMDPPAQNFIFKKEEQQSSPCQQQQQQCLDHSPTKDIKTDNQGISQQKSVPTLRIDPNSSDTTSDLHLHGSLSPLVDMDWMDAENSQAFLGLGETSLLPNEGSSQVQNTALDSNVFDLNDNGNLDWLSEVMHQDDSAMDTASHSFNSNFTSDPVLTPKSQDVLNIFNMEESDFRGACDGASSSGINWDKLIGQASPQQL